MPLRNRPSPTPAGWSRPGRNSSRRRGRPRYPPTSASHHCGRNSVHGTHRNAASAYSRRSGKYRIKGRDEAGREKLLLDAAALAEAGAFAVVLEIVTPPVAAEITAKFPFATIGIGSGPDCDGQTWSTFDLIGAFPWFTPKFVKPRLNVAEQVRSAVADWKKSL